MSDDVSSVDDLIDSRANPVAFFAAVGFTDAAAAARSLLGLAADAGKISVIRAVWARLREALARCPDPDLAWQRFITTLEGHDPEGLLAWSRGPARLEGWLTLAGSSPFLGELLRRHDEAYDPESWAGEDRDLAGRLRARLFGTPCSYTEALDRLRRFKREETLWIAYRDYILKAPVEDVAASLGELADHVIGAAFEVAAAEVARRFRMPDPPGEGLAIIGLGKLGGRELNYSSDVDVIFISGQGPVGAAVADPVIFFQKWAETIIDVLTRFTVEGRLFVVDTRLRPGGSAGHLVRTLEGTIQHYQSSGRIWERQVLLRARAVAGDLRLGERFCDEIDPLVYRRYLSFDEIQEMKRIKGEIEKGAGERAEPQVKTGPGGIRDVEYITQFLQLLDGARYPELKTGNVFEILRALKETGVLTPDESDTLSRGYSFLRTVEHRLQMEEHRQTFTIPRDPVVVRRIARTLGYEGEAEFREAYASCTGSIRRIFRQLFQDLFTGRDAEAAGDVNLILDIPPSPREVAAVLGRYRFRDPAKAYGRLRSLAGEGSLFSPRTRKVFASIVGSLLREFSRLPDPDRALEDFDLCVSTLGARSVFYQLLAEDPKTLRLFLDICTQCRLVVEILRQRPGIFDEVVDLLLMGTSFERYQLTELVRVALVHGGEHAIFDFKYIQMVLIAIRDVQGTENLIATMANLSALADAIVFNLIARAREETEERYGRLRGTGGTPRYVLVALGKYGGEELNYTSDLDLVFIYQGEGKTDGGMTAREYFTHFFQNLLAKLRVAGPLGPLYEVDLRLRPMWRHESLVLSYERLRGYFEGGEAAVWEALAFTRARIVAGDPTLGRRIISLVREVVAGGRSVEEVFPAAREMRETLEENASPDDLKRGVGGVMDIEFFVQATQLVHGSNHPGILHPNTARALQAIGAAALLPPPIISDLLTAYEFLRRLETRLGLLGAVRSKRIDFDSPEATLLALRLGYAHDVAEGPNEILRQEYAYHTRRVRWIFEETIGKGGG